MSHEVALWELYNAVPTHGRYRNFRNLGLLSPGSTPLRLKIILQHLKRVAQYNKSRNTLPLGICKCVVLRCSLSNVNTLL